LTVGRGAEASRTCENVPAREKTNSIRERGGKRSSSPNLDPLTITREGSDE